MAVVWGPSFCAIPNIEHYRIILTTFQLLTISPTSASRAWHLHHLCLTVLSLSRKRNAKNLGQEGWLIVSSLLLSSIYWRSTHEKIISGQTKGPHQAEQQMLRTTRYLGIYPSLEMPSQSLENCLLASAQVPLFSYWNKYIPSGAHFSGTHKKGWDKGDLKTGEAYKEAEL